MKSSKLWGMDFIKSIYLLFIVLLVFSDHAFANENTRWKLTVEWANGEELIANVQGDQWEVFTALGIELGHEAYEAEVQSLDAVSYKLKQAWEALDPVCDDCTTYSEKMFFQNGAISHAVDIQGNGKRLEEIYDSLGSAEQTSRIEQRSFINDTWVETKTWNLENHKELSSYEAPGLRIDYHYADGILTKTEKDLSGGSSDRVSTISYNSDWRVTHIDGPKEDIQDVTEFTYSNGGKTVTATNILGHSEVYSFDEASRIESIINANGALTEYTRNQNGKVIEVTTSFDGSSLTTGFTYDDYGKLIEVDTPNEGVLTGFYLVDGTPNSYGQQVLKQYENYINPDYVKHILEFHLLPPTKSSSLRQIEALLPNNASEEAQYAYDNLGHITEIVNANGDIVSFDYDVMGNLSKITDARGNKTKYRYNGFGERTQENGHAAGKSTFTYDAAGNLKKRSWENGVELKNKYDELNRLRKRVFRENGEDVKTQRYVYDNCPGGVGRLCKIIEEAITTEYSYNQLGQFTEVKIIREGEDEPEVTEYRYDDTGRLKTLYYPSGLRVGYKYSNKGNVSKITANIDGTESIIAKNIEYDEIANRIRQLQFGNGLKTKMTYNADEFVTKIVTKNALGKIEDRRMVYDDRGNILSIERLQSPEFSRGYVYDDVNRLQTELVGNSQQIVYEYDVSGNRETKSVDGDVTSYAYGADSNRLEGIGNEVLSYDERGNLIEDKKGKRSFAYNVANRMSEYYKNGNLMAEYEYNAFGQRISKILRRPARSDDDHKTIFFSYLPDGRMLSEVGRISHNEKTFSRDYIWLGRKPLAQIERRGNNVRTSYIHSDHLDTPRMATNDDATVVWRWDADAFGSSISAELNAVDRDPDGDGQKTKIRLRFPGQYADQESKLFYNHNRDYDPRLGRYIQSDPIGLLGGINNYSYVHNNPIRYVDRKGLDVSNCYPTPTGVACTYTDPCPPGFTCMSYSEAVDAGWFDPDPFIDPYEPPEPSFDPVDPNIAITLNIKSCDANDQAAYDQLEAAMQHTIASGQSREIGAWNYRNPGGSIGSTPPRTGPLCPPNGACLGPSIGSDVNLIPNNATEITMWHTHGLNSSNSIFSYHDYVLMQGGHPNNPLNSSQQANLVGGYFMNSNFQVYFYRSGDLPNYTIAEGDTAAQALVASRTQGAAKQVIGCQ